MPDKGDFIFTGKKVLGSPSRIIAEKLAFLKGN
jgi:hypothetical protein